MDWIVFGRGPMCPGDDSGGEAAAAAGKGPSSSQCPHCAALEAELRAERDERRELSLENRRLWKENAELRERCARFEERAVARSAPQPGIVDQEERQGSVPDVFEERPPIPSNDVIRVSTHGQVTSRLEWPWQPLCRFDTENALRFVSESTHNGGRSLSKTVWRTGREQRAFP